MKTVRRLLKLALFTSALCCALAPPSRSGARQADGRGVGLVHIRVEDGKEVRLYEKSYALVVGVSDYTQGWPKLPGVKKDIEEVSRALERHGFLVTKVENPDAAQLDKSFRELIDAYGRGVENRLLFYFAGHGHTVRQSYGEEMGYIVPSDAPLPARDPSGFMSKAMDMQQMELYARRIQSKHALFLFDSCFSGALFALSRAVPESISYKTARPVRQFITSGSADEQVPDRSIFRRQFVEALEGEADLNRDGYVTGTELGEFLQDKVINYSRNAQHPQYGKLRNPNLDKGDFVFALPKKAAPSAVAVKPNVVEPASPAPARVDPAQQELAFWNSVQNSNDPDDFKDYLEKYPAGLYAGIARRKLAALTSAAKSAPATPTTGGAASNTTGAARPASPKPLVTNRVGIELVYVSSGEFMMGSSEANVQRALTNVKSYNSSASLDWFKSERPQHRVTISDGFYMGRYEVTQAQWQAVMGTNPSNFKGDNLPVEQVSWNDAQEFIRKLNAMNDDYQYRLPSEAEWEYAARAGTTTEFAFGNSLGSGQANFDGNHPFGRAAQGIYRQKTTPVGSFQANGWGLYDMHGNVSEWCEDVWHATYDGAPADGSAWLSGGDLDRRVWRGGSWVVNAFNLRSTYRDRLAPAIRFHIMGFRVVAVAWT
jgi:formylglycine-generating enzyme required for sulfatase activity